MVTMLCDLRSEGNIQQPDGPFYHVYHVGTEFKLTALVTRTFTY